MKGKSGMRITKDPEERKQEILDTSMEIFCEKGYDKTSISDIAKKMGVAQGLCYRYFKSKEEIFNSAIEHYADMQAAQMKKVLFDNSSSLKTKLKRKMNFIDFEKNDINYYKVFHGKDSEKIHNQLLMKVSEKMYPAVCNVLREEIEEGNINLKFSDLETVASFIVYGQFGILIRTDLTNEEKEKRIYSFIESLLY